MIGAIALSGIITSVNLLGSIDGLNEGSFCYAKAYSKTLEGCSSRLGQL